MRRFLLVWCWQMQESWCLFLLLWGLMLGGYCLLLGPLLSWSRVGWFVLGLVTGNLGFVVSAYRRLQTHYAARLAQHPKLGVWDGRDAC